jgi:hypothetical protein
VKHEPTEAEPRLWSGTPASGHARKYVLGWLVAVGHESVATGRCRSWGYARDAWQAWASLTNSRIAAVPFTLRNLREDLEDLGSNFDGSPDLEFRHASKALELEQCGLSYQRIPPDYRFPYGHTHKEQEEVYVVVRGSGRMKLDERGRRGQGVGRGARPARDVARLRGRADGPRDPRLRCALSRREPARRRGGSARLVA